MKRIFLKSVCLAITALLIFSVGLNKINVLAVVSENTQQGIQNYNSKIVNEELTEPKINNYDNSYNDSIIDNFYISENNYKEQMDSIVIPYIDGRMESGYIKGVDNVNIYYEKYKADDAKGNIVISHGYTESLEKYHEMIYYFLKSGYNVFGIEHRGHGRSGSLGVADESQIYVNSFNDYIEDFKTFMDEVVVPNSEGKDLFLFAHSMGGGIGTGFLESYPEYFDKAVLNAPMLEVDTGNIPDFIAKIVVKAAVLLGQDGKYVIGKKPFSPSYSFNSIGTTSENRWTYVNDIINENEELQRGEASYQWTNEAFKATKQFVKKENAAKVEIPVLLFQSGDDAYVRPGGQNKFAKYAQNCELRRIDNAKHEIYFERDEIQNPYLKELMEFYNE